MAAEGRYLMLCVAGPHAWQFLNRYDPEARGGFGEAEWTADAGSAMVFTDQEAALKCWRQIPVNKPVRPDGKPNRPLTAYTIAVVNAEKNSTDLAGMCAWLQQHW